MPPQGGQRPRSHRAASERRAWAETIVRAEVRGKEIYEHLRQEIRAFPAEFLLFFPVAAVLRSMMANSPHEYSGSNPIAFSAFCTTVEELPSGARLLKEETERLAQLPEPWEGLEFENLLESINRRLAGIRRYHTRPRRVGSANGHTRNRNQFFCTQRASGLAQNRR
jgi:hypothetical protein